MQNPQSNISRQTIKRFSTGNEYISIADVSAETAGIKDIGFVHKAFRSCIEMHGSDSQPLFEPLVRVNGANIEKNDIHSEQISYWIPKFTFTDVSVSAEALVFAPLDRRGFICVLTVENTSSEEIKVQAGWGGCWQSSSFVAGLARPVTGRANAHISKWHSGIPVIELRGELPLFAMSMAPQTNANVRMWSLDGEKEVTQDSESSISEAAGSAIYYEVVEEYNLKPAEKAVMPVYVGVGLEEVSAVGVAYELRLHGWERMFANLQSWLDNHTIEHSDSYFKRIINLNLFYNYFYSHAITLDTGEPVVITARSSRCDFCGIYRGRDAMMWSLPALLRMSWVQARKILIYIFTDQLANVGLRSRFIDGVVLEPGLQLDQLCSSIRALHSYVQVTGDLSVLFDRRVQTGVNTVSQILAVQRHADKALFETLYLPSGKPSKYPYVCFSNVLVWRSLLDMSWMYNLIRDIDRSDEASALAAKVKSAIIENFITPGPFGDMFAKGTDIQGNYEIGDDPEGSLQLMTHFGFCSENDPVYINTVKWIHSEHNPGAANYYNVDNSIADNASDVSLLCVVNDLITNRQKEALEFLSGASLDNGLACMNVDRKTGGAVSGEAFANLSGYFAYALCTALGIKVPATATAGLKRQTTESLYQPPPETILDSRKARL